MPSHDVRQDRTISSIERTDDTDSLPAGPGRSQTKPSPAASSPEPQFAESPLPAAMLAVAHRDTPENRRALYQSMFRTWFLVPTRSEPPEKPGFHDVQKDTASSFSLEHDSNGLVVAVAFTDEEALRNWNKSIPWIALQGTAFFQAVASTEAEEIVINPYEPEDPKSRMIRPGGRVKRWELESLAQGVVPEPPSGEDAAPQPADSQGVLVSMPRHMPSAEMFKQLSGAAQGFSQVVAMYFAQVGFPSGNSEWTVAVEFSAGASEEQIDQAMTVLAREAGRIFPRKRHATLLPASTPLGEAVARMGEKFYPAAG